MIVRQAKEEELEEILNLYYESSKEMLGIDDIQEMIEYDRRMYGEQYKFLSLENLKNGSKEILINCFHHIEKRNPSMVRVLKWIEEFPFVASFLTSMAHL